MSIKLDPGVFHAVRTVRYGALALAALSTPALLAQSVWKLSFLPAVTMRMVAFNVAWLVFALVLDRIIAWVRPVMIGDPTGRHRVANVQDVRRGDTPALAEAVSSSN